MSFVFWSPLTRSSTLKLLSQGTPRACLVSPWVPSISISSVFWAQTKLILSWQLESKLIELIGTSLCLTDNSYACLFSKSAFKKIFSKLCPVAGLQARKQTEMKNIRGSGKARRECAGGGRLTIYL